MEIRFEDLFRIGLKRTPGRLIAPPAGMVLNLGSGYSPLEGAMNLDRPGWQAPTLSSRDETIAAVHMHHFLEHLSPSMVIEQLIEVERVLMPRGVAFVTVPLYPSPLAFSDVTHRSFFTEETFEHLFTNKGYNPVDYNWKFRVSYQIIAGVVSRNLCVFTQLYKGA